MPYLQIIYHGTITPYKDFIAEKDAAVLQKSIADPGNGEREKRGGGGGGGGGAGEREEGRRERLYLFLSNVLSFL